MLVKSIVPALFISLLACSGSNSAGECEGLNAEQCTQPDAGAPLPAALVVDTAWLQTHLDDADIQLVDTRASGYATSRIPGAIHLRPGDLVTTIEGVSSQIKMPTEAQPVLREAGLENEVVAVVYGAPPEYDPSRVVWSLLYYQHGDVRYLDGGYGAWVDAGGDLDTDPPDVAPSDYTIVGVDDSLRATGDWVLQQLGDPPYDTPTIQLVDARSDGEYAGGRIPTASSVNWTRNLVAGFLLPESNLAMLYEGLDPTKTTVTYCVSGWRGSFAWLTLTALGYEDVKLYDGSWNEWGPGDFPVER